MSEGSDNRTRFAAYRSFGPSSLSFFMPLIVRVMARTGLALRRLIVPVLIELTGAGSLPRLWHL